MRSSLPTVSIGLPVHNGDRHLRSALDSLLAQDYPNIELLIADNASTDRTAEICHEYVRDDARVQYHRNDTNVGAARNFNGVFERSSGKYFMWAAHDDEWCPTYVTRCAKALEENPELVLCGTDITFIDERGETTSYPRDFNRLDTCSMNLRQRAKALTDKLDWFAIYGLIRAETLRQTRLATEEYGADVILLLELLLRGQTLILTAPLFRCRFVQKTAEKHLEEISGAIRKGDFKPYTELAKGLLQVIESSHHSATLKREMVDDLLDNVCQNNEAWHRNIISENPTLLQVPGPLRSSETRRLFVATRPPPQHAATVLDDNASHYTTPAPRLRASPGRFGFNVIGFVSGNLGLGVSARNIVAALLAHGFPVSVLDLDPGLDRAGFDTSYAHLGVRSPLEMPYEVNLIVFPLDLIAGLVLSAPAAFARSDRLNVACTWWELSVLPEKWRHALECFDAVVAYSEFIRHALDFKLSGPAVISARHPLYLPSGISAQRERFGISSDDLVFVTSLELGSDPIRKNAHAAIEAFNKGLHDVPDARLMIKVNNVYAPAAAYLASLERAAALDPRIRILTEKLTYSEILSLYKSADAYVSLHRSEGLGFGLMEAMTLGKPVIATAWSGNMTYMDQTNACLVPYKLVPVQASVPAYSAQALAGLDPVWAEPSIDDAAIWMRRLASDSALRAEIGRNAAMSMASVRLLGAEMKFAYEIRAIWEQRRYSGLVPDWDRRLNILRNAVGGGALQPENWIRRFRRRVGRYLEERIIGQPLRP